MRTFLLITNCIGSKPTSRELPPLPQMEPSVDTQLKRAARSYMLLKPRGSIPKFCQPRFDECLEFGKKV